MKPSLKTLKTLDEKELQTLYAEGMISLADAGAARGCSKQYLAKKWDTKTLLSKRKKRFDEMINNCIDKGEDLEELRKRLSISHYKMYGLILSALASKRSE